MTPWWLYAWFVAWGAVLGAVGAHAYLQRRSRQRLTVAKLHVRHCVLINCEPQMLVTYNEDEGVSELRDYCIMPRELWEAIEPQVQL